MKNIGLLLIILLIISGCFRSKNSNLIPLAGEWTFKTDPMDNGVDEKWYITGLNDTIHLPGSMTENGKGDDITLHTPWTGQIEDSSWFKSPRYEKYRQPGNIKIPFWLQPVKYYKGAAWYQKKIDIPISWRGKHLELFLERCHWESHLWIDDKDAGYRNSLASAHVYDLTSLLTPGSHTLTLRIDNRIKDIDVGMNSHSITDHTQSNWNGIVGTMVLRALSPLYASHIRVYPDLKQKKVVVKMTLNNITGGKVSGKLDLSAVLLQANGEKALPGKSQEVNISGDSTEITMDYPMGADPALWDEFHPNLYRLTVHVSGAGDAGDQHSVLFGMREMKTQGTQFTINGRPTFMRGTLECAIFPKTGYPPTDTASWMRIFKIARAHGLNMLRFHSWCPPDAAFDAADRCGFYLHIECGSWANTGASIGDGKPLDQYLYDESNRIIDSYGNHPSFCMMLYGNEPAGANQTKWLGDFVSYWKKKDPRRLYSSGAGWPLLPETDFNSSPNPRIQGWGQGLNSIINGQPPRSDYDWSDIIHKEKKPTLSHEIGQWCVYPDFKEIKKYTGVLKAKNFEIFQETLEQNHLGQLADSFLLASGKLQALCYKADIEAALRTPGFGGFQLLDLHDFPGQGTALVGVLNPFWEEKGYISPDEYRKFCNSVVPLIRLPKMIYTNAETLRATAEIANFGDKELTDVVPEWSITRSDGKKIASGTLPKTSVPLGNGIRLGEISQSLSGIDTPQKCTLSLMVGPYENSWGLWIYPSNPPAITNSPLVVQKLDAKTMDLLVNGANILLTVKKGSVKKESEGSVAVGFSSIFWNTAWTNKQPPHTLGILCNPKHAALAFFPTEYHSNWQWWDAMSHADAIDISGFSQQLHPIVRIIDDWFTNRSLALVFEARVGKGKIIVTGIDLISNSENRPEARQLLYSLKYYMAGKSFNPTTEIEPNRLKEIFNH